MGSRPIKKGTAIARMRVTRIIAVAFLLFALLLAIQLSLEKGLEKKDQYRWVVLKTIAPANAINRKIANPQRMDRFHAFSTMIISNT
ncbi:hypothetical protein KKA14_15270 [bacterium]|nr:hypothetical protein [bacterium]